MNRSQFIRQTAFATAALALPTPGRSTGMARTNRLPAWKGFNLLDFVNPDPNHLPAATTADHFKWMQDWGFNFVRLPIAYPVYLDFDRTRNIEPEEVYHINQKMVDGIDRLVLLAQSNGMHVSINLHRAPGYCINAGFHEPYNLWKDQAAQEAFYFHWAMWAKRYKGVSAQKISFDLVNEPCMREDMNDQHSPHSPLPGALYRRVINDAAKAIRQENPERLVIADGNNIGNAVIPEIVDLNIGQSCRGYYPGAVSHYKAPWANADPDHQPAPLWPGQVGGQYLSRAMLEEYYKPWSALVEQGVGVHCGECGCWNKTPHPVFLSWFTDVLDILTKSQIGYALWNFIGDFGILDSRRADLEYTDWYGHKLDSKLLQLLQAH